MNRYKKTVLLSLLTVAMAYQNISASGGGGASAGEGNSITLKMVSGKKEIINVPEGTTYEEFMEMVADLYPKKILAEDMDGNRIDISKQRVYEANSDWMNWTEELMVRQDVYQMRLDERMNRDDQQKELKELAADHRSRLGFGEQRSESDCSSSDEEGAAAADE